MLQDLMNMVDVKRVISAVSVADNTAQVGQIIDHQGAESVTYILDVGSVADADATFTVLLEEGNDASLSDAAAVADADLIGTEALAGFQFDSDNKVFKLGYKGAKRYSRMTVTPANNASAALFGVVCVLEKLNTPTANPPA